MSRARIRSPRWSQPVFTAPGDVLSIAVDLPVEVPAIFSLVIDQASVAMDILDEHVWYAEGIVQYRVRLPDTVPNGLADLVLAGGGKMFVQPRAVVVRTEQPDRIRLAYTSDWHLLSKPDEGGSVDRSALFFELADHMNELGLDALIHTGDVITRYTPEGLPLPDEIILRQMAQAQEIFELLKVPVFVLPGNHDVAFEICRSAWRDMVGWPWERQTDDVFRVLGPCELVMMDGFAFYDEQTGKMLAHSLTDEQIVWLEDVVRKRKARWRILALHYDYSKQVLPRFQELGFDVFFYGHSKSEDVSFFERSGTRNGHLPGDAVYRVMEATAEDLMLGDAVTFADLGIG
ncbi:MAG: metallophosphoesterase [bacterium]|nr:metallophosphoesterase [bacterium]